MSAGQPWSGCACCSLTLFALVGAAAMAAACEPKSDARAPMPESAPTTTPPSGSVDLSSQLKSTSNSIATASAATLSSSQPTAPSAADSSAVADSSSDPTEAAALAQMSDTQRAVLLAVKACVERGLRKNEEPRGSMAIELTVAADGSVASQKLADGYPPGIRACVEGRVRSMQFPKGDGMRVFRFPINESSHTEP